MSRLPTPVDPLDRSILDLLCRVGPRWEPYDPDALSSTEQRALRLMVLAGLIELRVLLRGQMSGQRGTLQMTLTVSGQYDASALWRIVLRHAPQWLDEEGRTRGRCHIWSQPHQVRLSDQGELARRDYENRTGGNPSAVCAFVRRTGLFAQRPNVEARICVERAECTSTPEASSDASGAAMAAAQATANASVGDLTIKNHIHINTGEIAEAILAEVRARRDAAVDDTGGAKRSPAQAPPAGVADDEMDGGSSDSIVDGPVADRFDGRVAWWLGKRIYLGSDTQISRLFWLLARPVGRARDLPSVQRAIDGIETSERVGNDPEEIHAAALRVRKAVSKLRDRLREAQLDHHVVIVREGPNAAAGYTMVMRHGRS